jgi:hypothetical protein
MELWQRDIGGGVLLAGDGETKVVTGVDGHSGCLIAAVVPKATGRGVCLALSAGLREYSVPEDLLTDIQARCRPRGSRIVRPAV